MGGAAGGGGVDWGRRVNRWGWGGRAVRLGRLGGGRDADAVSAAGYHRGVIGLSAGGVGNNGRRWGCGDRRTR
jgi:hypothetical protein